MSVIDWKKDESVAIISMCNGANRQNQAFVDAMTKCFDEIMDDKEISSIVLTSSDEKNFCQGIDVEWLGQKMNDKAFDDIKTFMFGMNDIFKRILMAPVPVIASINGHAFGNGAMLACACDYRFMKSDRGFFCFPEVDISIPFLPGMIAFVRKAMPEYKFNEMILTGKRAGAQELEEDHAIVKASANQDELLADTLAFARTFAKKRGIFGLLKERMHKNIVKIMDTEDKEVIESLQLFVAE
jgi:enoyl-CoA hydratase/carnithine racemase